MSLNPGRLARPARRSLRTVIDAQREALLRLRAEGAIDDDVLRAFDLEERRTDTA